MTFPRNCRPSYDMLGLPFFVVRENPVEHWLGNEIQTLNPRPNLDLGISMPHFGSTPGLKSRPNLGLGTSMLYISPRLIRARLLGRIKEPTRYFCSESLIVKNLCGHNIPLMLFLKDAMFWCAWFSCHYYLTVHEPGRRAC